MLKEIKNINPDRLTGVEELRSAVVVLLNVVEQLIKENGELLEKNQALRDENNKLKGGNARPQIKPNVKPSGDLSSQGKEKGEKKVRRCEEMKPVGIDREVEVEVPKEGLPPDAIFKGHVAYIQQDLMFRRDNKRFLFQTYYSPLENRTIRAEWPEGTVPGHYGAGLRSVLNVLHHFGNMTEGTLETLLDSLGIRISAGTISNLLKGEGAWAVEEQGDILSAALHVDAPKQMDATGNRQKGVNKVTHIITAPFFSVFYTLGGKSRLECLRALQGNPAGDIKLLWHEGLKAELLGKVAAADRQAVGCLMVDKPCLPLAEFDALLKDKAPEVFAKTGALHKLRDAMAMAHYAQQTDFPRPKVLLSDGAPEYETIAPFHGLCWVHDARYYNKLFPNIALHEQKLDDFKALYWGFYRKLLDFKEQNPQEQNRIKDQLSLEFDQIFSQKTKYGALDLTIERTRDNKADLLRVLDFPDLPLHNNAAELAARKVVRKRDISLHTWSDWGTQLRDAFMSIIETARKLNISAYDFIYDRIAQQFKLPSLAKVIYPEFTRTF